jgi:predicted nucleotidyltransferase
MRDLAREQLLAELRALRPQFEREGVVGMSLFGSRARGDNGPESDIDIVVELAPGRKFSMIDAIGVSHIVEDSIGIETSVVVLDDYAPKKFVAALQRDRVPVF